MLTFGISFLFFCRVNWSAHEKHLLTHYQKKLHERPFHTKSFQTLHATAPVTHFPRTVTLFSGFNPERTQNLKIFNNSPTHSVKFGILHVRYALLVSVYPSCVFVVFCFVQFVVVCVFSYYREKINNLYHLLELTLCMYLTIDYFLTFMLVSTSLSL